MKHIGIIGGLSPESTIEYYKLICSEYNKKYGGWSYPHLTIRSLNLQEIAELFKADRWDEMADRIVTSIQDLEKAGADFSAIATNTPHQAYERISRKSPLFVLSIMDATARAIRDDDNQKVGLLGTLQTMEYGYYQRKLKEYDIETIIPEQDDRKYIDQVIWDELVTGTITEKAKKGYLEIIEKLCDRGAEGIILGCTEIPLLIKPEDSPVTTYDTTTLHAHAILDYALANDI